MAARNYSSVARLATLTAGVSNSSTSLAVDQVTGFPTAPFTLVIDPGRAAEEIVTVTSIVGLALVAQRGQDGSAAQPHDAGAEVRHMATARDFREAAEHISATSGVHGSTGLLVDTASDQVIDNKTFTPSATDHVALKVQAAGGQSADLLGVYSAGSLRLGGWKVSGRLEAPGVDGTSTSTFTAGTAATVPLIAKGAASQTAKLLSARTSADAEVASIDPAGVIAGTTVTAPIVTGTTVTGATVLSTTQHVASTPAPGTTPLIVKQPALQSVPSFSVRDSLDVNRAGVGTEAQGFRLFHGDAANLLPWRMHAGSVNVSIGTGNNSTNGTVDLTPYGFTVRPLIFVSIHQNEEGTVQRRVAANVYDDVDTVQFSYRVYQTAGEAMPQSTPYAMRWFAIQMTPSSASG